MQWLTLPLNMLVFVMLSDLSPEAKRSEEAKHLQVVVETLRFA